MQRPGQWRPGQLREVHVGLRAVHEGTGREPGQLREVHVRLQAVHEGTRRQSGRQVHEAVQAVHGPRMNSEQGDCKKHIAQSAPPLRSTLLRTGVPTPPIHRTSPMQLLAPPCWQRMRCSHKMTFLDREPSASDGQCLPPSCGLFTPLLATARWRPIKAIVCSGAPPGCRCFSFLLHGVPEKGSEPPDRGVR